MKNEDGLNKEHTKQALYAVLSKKYFFTNN